jgi:hypothetical protein
VVNFTHWPLYPWGNDPPITIGYEAGWAPQPVCTFCRRDKSLAPARIDPVAWSLYRLSYPGSRHRWDTNINMDLKYDGKVWTGITWFRISTSDRLMNMEEI